MARSFSVAYGLIAALLFVTIAPAEAVGGGQVTWLGSEKRERRAALLREGVGKLS
jgi:hypothetical protein